MSIDCRKVENRIRAKAALRIALAFGILAVSPCQPASATDNAIVSPSAPPSKASNSLSPGDKFVADYDKSLRESVELNTKTINQEPRNIDAYMRRAHAYENLKQFQQAINDYSKVIEIDPQSNDAYQKRGDINRYALEQFQQAIADYNVSISLDPYNADAFLGRGDTFEKLGRYEDAIRDFTKAIDLDPRKTDSYLSRSEAYRNLGKEELAKLDYFGWKELIYCRGNVERCSAALSADPDNVGLYFLRAEAFSYRKQFNGALEDLDRIISLKPSAEAYYLRGRVWMELRNPGNAIADFGTAIGLDSHGAQARHCKLNTLDDCHRGTVYKARGSALIEQCQRNYRTAYIGRGGELQSYLATAARGMQMFSFGSPGYESAARFQASLLDGLRKTEKAEEEYRKAIQDYGTAISLDSKDAEAYEKRASAYQELHQYYDAIRDYDSALALGTSSWLCTSRALLFIQQATCYEQVHQYQNAIANYSTVVEEMTRAASKQAKRSNNTSQEVVDWIKNMDKLTISLLADAYEKRGKLYRQSGRHQFAQADLNEAYRLDPSKAEFEASLNKWKRGVRRKWF